MMNEQEHGESMRRIRAWFWDVLREWSRRDYLAAGNSADKPRRNKKGEVIHIPYVLGIDTSEAMEHYKLSLNGDWTDEQENRIKAYRLKIMPRIEPARAIDNPWI